MTNKIILAVAIISLIIFGNIYNENVQETKRKNDIEQKKLDLAREKQETEQQEKKDRELKFNACIDDSYANYESNWELKCQELSRPSGCNIPAYLADGLNDKLKEDKEICNKMFN